MSKIQLAGEQLPDKIKGFLWIRTEVFDNPDLSTSDIMVYATLMRYMNNKTKECYPSIETLCSQARLHKQTAFKSLDNLERVGLIKRRRIRGKVNRYIILEPPSTKISD